MSDREETWKSELINFLSEAGVCSRREADRQIEAGNVTIGGKTARMGDQVSDGQEVCFCGRPVQKKKKNDTDRA